MVENLGKQSIRNGNIVAWRDEYTRSDEEKDMLMIAQEVTDDGRCFVKPLDWDGSLGDIVPAQLVKTSWLRRA